jgi:hypothetical protein
MLGFPKRIISTAEEGLFSLLYFDANNRFLSATDRIGISANLSA